MCEISISTLRRSNLAFQFDDQVGATRDDAGIFAVLSQESQGVVKRGGGEIGQPHGSIYLAVRVRSVQLGSCTGDYRRKREAKQVR